MDHRSGGGGANNHNGGKITGRVKLVMAHKENMTQAPKEECVTPPPAARDRPWKTKEVKCPGSAFAYRRVPKDKCEKEIKVRPGFCVIVMFRDPDKIWMSVKMQNLVPRWKIEAKHENLWYFLNICCIHTVCGTLFS